MTEPVWVDRQECLAIHEMMLAQYGGSAGLRDSGGLDSALARPLNLFAYGSPTIAELAGSYAAGIIKSHPFLDGNKRTGFMLAAVFIEVNGCEFLASEESVVEFTLALAAGSLTEQKYAVWLKTNMRKRR